MLSEARLVDHVCLHASVGSGDVLHSLEPGRVAELGENSRFVLVPLEMNML